MKKTVAIILAALMMVSLFAGCGEKSGTITTTVEKIDEAGNIILKADIGDLKGEGIIVRNEVVVKTGSYVNTLLFNEDFLAAKGIEQIWQDKENDQVVILIYEGDFAETYGVKVGDEVTLTKVIQPAA